MCYNQLHAATERELKTVRYYNLRIDVAYFTVTDLMQREEIFGSH